MLYNEYIQSTNPVDIISFDNISIETDIAKRVISKGKRTGIIMKFAMSVSLGYKFINRFAGGVQWYMMETKDVISSISFKLKIEIIDLVSFNGQSISFGLSNKEI